MTTVLRKKVVKKLPPTEVCPECNEKEFLHDYPYDAELQFGGRMCVDCFHGEKDRECVDCGETFNPKEDSTVRRCGACYDARKRGGASAPAALSAEDVRVSEITHIWGLLWDGVIPREVAKRRLRALGEKV